jgi:hypothetical protein
MARRRKSHPKAMTDSAITLNEVLAARDAIDRSQAAAGASAGGVKSTLGSS